MHYRALMLTSDSWAILFLCCENHVVLCPGCRTGLKVRMLQRPPSRPEEYRCPRCNGNVTDAVEAHTETCHYFTRRKGPVKVERDEPLDERKSA